MKIKDLFDKLMDGEEPGMEGIIFGLQTGGTHTMVQKPCASTMRLNSGPKEPLMKF